MFKKACVVVGVLLLSACATGSDAIKQTQQCEPVDEAQIAALFERWNQSLQTGDPKAVVQNYADRSILLPTLSGVNRLSKAEKEDYFTHFLAAKPSGLVTSRMVDIACNTAIDSGLYTFTMGVNGKKVEARYTFTYKWIAGQWLITSHHSSLLPAEP